MVHTYQDEGSMTEEQLTDACAKHVVVTGGAGFVGSALVSRIREEHPGWTITVIDPAGTHHGCEQVDYIRTNVQEIYELSYFNSQNNNQPDIFFHLGATARIAPSFSNPIETWNNNVQATRAVLVAAERTGAKVIYAGSSTIHAGVRKNPYALSKSHGEDLCTMYSDHLGVKIAICRFFNVYGADVPRAGPSKMMMGIFMKQTLAGAPITVTGDGKQTRDFTHVRDICTGLLAAAALDHDCVAGVPVFELGAGRNVSVLEIASAFGQPIEMIDERKGEARDTLASPGRWPIGSGPLVDVLEWIAAWKKVEGLS